MQNVRGVRPPRVPDANVTAYSRVCLCKCGCWWGVGWFRLRSVKWRPPELSEFLPTRARERLLDCVCVCVFVCARRSRRRQCDARKSRTDRAGTGTVRATIKTRLMRERNRPHTIRHSSSAVFVVVVDRQTRSPHARAHRRFKQVFRFGERAHTRKSREKRASRAERKLEN